jgi:hypothetical protein
MFNRKPRHPVEWKLPVDLNMNVSSTDLLERVEAFKNEHGAIIEEAMANDKAAKEKQKLRHDSSIKFDRFEIGDVVWKIDPRKKKREHGKSDPRMQGKYEIIELSKNGLLYRLKNVNTNSVHKKFTNVLQLRRCQNEQLEPQGIFSN